MSPSLRAAWSCDRSQIHKRELSRRAPLRTAVAVALAVLLAGSAALRAEGPDDKAQAALKALSARFDDPKADREQLRRDLLALGGAFPGAPAAVRAAEMSRKLPSPLDRLAAQSKDFVAVLGTRHSKSDQSAGVAFSTDGKWVVVRASGEVRLVDAATLRQSVALEGATLEGAFSPDGKTLATDGPDETVRLWNLSGAAPRVRTVLSGHRKGVTAVAFSPDGKTLAAASAWPTVRLWDLSGPEPKRKAVIEESAGSLAFSPDGQTLAAGDWRHVHLWDLSGTEPKQRSSLHAKEPGFLEDGFDRDEQADGVIFSPDGKTLAAASSDHVNLWDLSGAEPKQQARLGGKTFAAFSLDGKTLAMGTPGGAVELRGLSMVKSAEGTLLTGHANAASQAAFSPDGKTLVVVCAADGTLQRWDLAAARPVEKGSPPGRSAQMDATAFSPDGRTLAAGCSDGTVRLWDFSAAPKEAVVLEGHTGDVIGAAFSADGETLATADANHAVRLWDLTGAAPKEAAVFNTPPDGLMVVAFSPDGKTLATGEAANSVRLWDLSGAAPKAGAVLKLEGVRIDSVAFSPDGKTLATGGSDGAVRLWDLSGAEPKERATLRANDTGQRLVRRLTYAD